MRDRLPLPDRATCLDYLADVRRAVLCRMEEIDPRSETPLLRDGYVFNMVLQHEYQHNETILQTLQLMEGEPHEGLAPDRSGLGARPSAANGTGRGPTWWVRGANWRTWFSSRAGDVFTGTDDRSCAYDNERPRPAAVGAFWIDRHPVDNSAFIDFIAAGGYRTDAHWSEAGVAWRTTECAQAPLFWFRRDGVWWTRTLGRETPVDPALPVCHVSWYEARRLRALGRQAPPHGSGVGGRRQLGSDPGAGAPLSLGRRAGVDLAGQSGRRPHRPGSSGKLPPATCRRSAARG